jgi:hypothetical protein
MIWAASRLEERMGEKKEVFYQRGESFAIKISLLRTGPLPGPWSGMEWRGGAGEAREIAFGD